MRDVTSAPVVQTVSAEERELLEGAGYDVRRNLNGGDLAACLSYEIGYDAAVSALAFVRKVGEEHARALDAVARLEGPAAGRYFRRRFEDGDFSLHAPDSIRRAFKSRAKMR